MPYLDKRKKRWPIAMVCAWFGLSIQFTYAQTTKGDNQSAVSSELPAGASSLTETFDDWTVSCVSTSETTQCVVWQTQHQRDNGQLVLDFRLNPVLDDNVYSGELRMPFGLDLSGGVTFQFENGQAGAPISFKTCLPNGCLVALRLNQPTIDIMQKSSTLKLAAFSIQNQTVPFLISLKGFSSAFKRAAALTKIE